MGTKTRNKRPQSYQLISYHESTGTASRKINLDFATDKTVNQAWILDWEGCGNQASCTNPGGMCRVRGSKDEQTGVRQEKGVKGAGHI